MQRDRRLGTVCALTAVAALVALITGCGRGKAPIKIGVVSDCRGGLSFLYDLTISAAELPLLERGGELRGEQPGDGVANATAAGRRLELVVGCAGSSTTSAVAETKRLVEREGVEIVIGPGLTAGLAVKAYAKQQPGIAFVGAYVIPQATTLRDPSPNFFSFSLDETQAAAGLGAYAHRLGWRNAVTVGLDEALNWGYAAGIVAEFCSLGGNIVKRVWVSPEADPASVLAAVPKRGVDGIFFVSPSGPQLLALANGLPLLRSGLAGKLVGGATVFVDPTQSLGKRLDGVVYSTGGTNGTPGSPGSAYTAQLAKAFPKLLRLTGLLAPAAGFGLGYYNAMEAVLTALDRVHGDLSDGEQRFLAALAKVELDAPNGHVRLDANRQAIAPNYLNRLEADGKGQLSARMIETIPGVDQTFGGLFTASSTPPGRTTPPCRHGNPPPWAR